MQCTSLLPRTNVLTVSSEKLFNKENPDYIQKWQQYKLAENADQGLLLCCTNKLPLVIVIPRIPLLQAKKDLWEDPRALKTTAQRKARNHHHHCNWISIVVKILQIECQFTLCAQFGTGKDLKNISWILVDSTLEFYNCIQ